MRFEETAVEGAFVVDLEPIEDDRGFFARSYCIDEFARNGIEAVFVQENVGFSHRRGTMRGLHFQRPPHAEVKLVRCTRGAVWDVALDLRSRSDSAGRWTGVELAADNRRMLVVPEGCAHGYLTLTDGAEVRYLTTRAYAPDAAGGVRYDDPAFSIAWPVAVEVVSAQDRSWPLRNGTEGSTAEAAS
jgi:dTDP-4-dehydrorhamnose 3,5-epimerase